MALPAQLQPTLLRVFTQVENVHRKTKNWETNDGGAGSYSSGSQRWTK